MWCKHTKQKSQPSIILMIAIFILVLEAGLEPAQPQWPRDFKSLVSTDSTIRATYGAENETRTRDPNLGKVVLYQLSYFRISELTGANLVHFMQFTKFSPDFIDYL